ncbi:MAG: cellulase family glycosylhydrolase [Sedimentisphaerales bacterium]|nr:cellulase family glycosylhydrolase [Sedimentisphaerales bacterium]
MDKMIRFAVLLAVSAGACARGQERVVFSCDFESGTSAGSGAGELSAGFEAGRGLFIERGEAGTSVRTFELDAGAFDDRFARLEAVVRAEDVSEPPNSWNGIKVMLVLESESGGRQYPQIRIPRGTFGWKKFSEVVRVPKGVKKAQLVTGLEAVSGRVWIDNVKVTVGRPPRKGRRSATKFTGHDEARLRGVMYGPVFRAGDIENLALKWKANQIRWQLNWVPMKQAEDRAQDMDEYDRWLDGALAECDKGLAACEKYGIKVLVDLHTPPGGRAEGGICRMFRRKRYQDKLIEVWGRIAGRYKGREIIYAYDLVNEAVEGAVGDGLMDWRELATAATRAIRAVDPGRAVVFEPSPWGGADGFDVLEPLDADRVIYSFHMYQPHSFTHQGVYDDKSGISYPGVIGGEQWDKQRLREAMLPAIEFQQAFNVQIYVGEFSVIRWAPGQSGCNYLRDVTELFEEYGWDWSYHAYREWDGWSVEHGPERNDRRRTAQPTERMKVLLGWFAKN